MKQLLSLAATLVACTMVHAAPGYEQARKFYGGFNQHRGQDAIALESRDRWAAHGKKWAELKKQAEGLFGADHACAKAVSWGETVWTDQVAVAVSTAPQKVAGLARNALRAGEEKMACYEALDTAK